MFSNTFAGIAPASVASFIAAQLLGGCGALLLIRTLYPGVTADQAEDVVFPHLEDASLESERPA
jgi:arsenate reductase